MSYKDLMASFLARDQTQCACKLIHLTKVHSIGSKDQSRYVHFHRHRFALGAVSSKKMRARIRNPAYPSLFSGSEHFAHALQSHPGTSAIAEKASQLRIAR